MMNVDLRDFLILLRYPVHRHSRVLSPSASPAQRAGYDVAGIQKPYQQRVLMFKWMPD